MHTLGTPGSPHPRKFMPSPLFQGDGDDADDEGDEKDEEDSEGGSVRGRLRPGGVSHPVVGLDEVAKKEGVPIEQLVEEEEQLEEAEIMFGGDEEPAAGGEGRGEAQPPSSLKKPGPHRKKAAHVRFAPMAESESEKRDESYFDSYSMFGIHR